MTRFLSTISILIIGLSSCGQTCKQYHFSDIGLTLTIPEGYVIQDSFPPHRFVDINDNPITDSLRLKDLESDLWKGLLIVSSKDRKNVMSFNIALETSKTGDFEKYYTFSKMMQKLMAKQQMIDYDTTASILHVDSINIYKFSTFSMSKKPTQYSEIYLAKVKSYFLIIKGDFKDEVFGEVVNKAILTSTFD